MDASLFTPTGTTALALSSLTLAGIGASVPAVADGILRRSRERYHAWLHSALEEYCAFWRASGHAPRKRSSGQERALFEWAAELPRLASDGMLSKHELRLVAAANIPLSAFVTEDVLDAAPSEEAVEREFSLPSTPLLVASGAILTGVASALSCIAWGFSATSAFAALFVASCWLMAVIDARSRTIPGVCTACIAASGIAWHIGLNEADITGSLAVAFATWALLAIGNRLSCALRGERGIGGGDVRTLPVVVGVLGASGAVLGLSASAGALAAYLAVKAVKGSLSLREKIPFGPFIAVAGIAGMASLALG